MREEPAREPPGTEPTLDSGTLDESGVMQWQPEWGRFDSGDRIGRYLLLEHLGSGGMGTVFAAYDPQLDRRVALKLLRAEANHPEAHRRAQARLLREAQALAQLNHPNVVAVHDAGEAEGRVYLAMEFVQGRTLGEALDAVGGWRAGLELCIAAGRGLAAAHACGLIHRDFKPANVMVGDDGRVRVMDFGLARAEATREPVAALDQVDVASRLTRQGSLMGTPAYMSPEQLVLVELGPATDQFSFCVVAYEVLYGERPYQGRTLMELATEVLERPPRAPAHRKGVPSRIHRAILRGLARDPEARYPSIGRLLDELEAGLRGRGRAWLGVGLGAVGLASGVALASAETEAPGPTCTEQAAEIRDVWSPARRDALEQAFESTGRAHAAETAKKVGAAFDAWSTRWQAASAAACRGEGDFPVALAEQRRRCYGRARVQFGALVQALLVADATAVDKAVSASGSLPDLSSCDDPVSVASSETAPPPKVREAVEDAEAELARLDALAELGHHRDVLKPARALLEQAEGLAFAPLRVAARWRLGTALERSGARDEAESVLREGYADAVANGRDAKAVELATRLAYLVGYAEGRPAEGKLWGLQAQAWIRRTGADPLREGKLLNDMGSVYLGAGEYPKALEAWERSFELRASALDASDPRMAGIHYNLGIGHQVNGDMAAAREHWQRALELREASYGELHPFVADSIDTVAIATKHLGDLEAAMALYERALELRTTTLGSDHPDVAVSRVNLGQALTAAQRWPEAETQLREALRILEAANPDGHPDLAYPLEALADLEVARARPENAPPLRTRALAEVESRLGAEHPRALGLRLDLAEDLLGVGASARARKVLQSEAASFEALEGGSDLRERFEQLRARAVAVE